jgi:hypothetical protein
MTQHRTFTSEGTAESLARHSAGAAREQPMQKKCRMLQKVLANIPKP